MSNISLLDGHSQFVVRRDFIETPFEKRFQNILRQAWQRRSWHIISAVPGSGKSQGIDDLLRTSGAYKSNTGTTYLPVLVVRAPKNSTRDQALGVALSNAFGYIPTMSWNIRRLWLVKTMASANVEFIVIDDAHDLNRFHLALLKELTDNLAAYPYKRQVGLALVVANSGDVVPLKEIITTPEVLWRQFYWRMDREHPFYSIAGHTQEEVLSILGAFELLYRDQLPQLRLRRWAKSIFDYLTNPILDIDGMRRVIFTRICGDPTEGI